MSDYGIKAEWREAWKFTDKFCPGEGETYSCALVNLAVHLLAGWMRSEFRHEHQLDGRGHLIWCSRCSYGDSHRAAPPDPRHNFTDDDWLRAAREELGK